MSQSPSNHDSTWEKIELELNDESFQRFIRGGQQQQRAAPERNMDTSVVSMDITPDPLNIGFVSEESHLSESQNQTSSSIRHNETMVEQNRCFSISNDTAIQIERERISLGPVIPNVVSTRTTATMTETPVTISVGTMPQTPVVSPVCLPETIDLYSSATPTTIDLVSPMPETIDLCTPSPQMELDSSNSTLSLAPP